MLKAPTPQFRMLPRFPSTPDGVVYRVIGTVVGDNLPADAAATGEALTTTSRWYTNNKIKTGNPSRVGHHNTACMLLSHISLCHSHMNLKQHSLKHTLNHW